MELDETPPPEDENEFGETRQLSWAAYFGGAAGLVSGVIVAMLLSATLYGLTQHPRLAEIFWDISSPLFGFLGVLVGSFLFHRLFIGQILVPALLFLTLLAAGCFLVFAWIGFPWIQ
jgi:hypothetical protein